MLLGVCMPWRPITITHHRKADKQAHFEVFCDSRIAALALRLPPSLGPRDASGLAVLVVVVFRCRATRRRD